MDDGHAMNFSLKRKAGADARPKRPRGGGAFGGDSDSDSPDPEQQFKQAIAAKTTAAEIETARAASQTEVAAEAAQAPPARTQDAPRLVSRILEAKRVRQQEQRAAQLMHDEAKLQQYLKENQDALVFASDAYTRQQEEVRVLERQRSQHDAAAAAAAPSQSFYAKMIRAQAGEPPESGPPQESGPPAQAGGATGTDPSDGEAHARPSGAVTSPAAEVSASAAASAAAAASASASEAAPAASAAAAALTPALSRRIRSTVTPQDIEEAKEKYWQRKAGHIN